MSPRNLQARDLLLLVDRSRAASASRQLEEQMRSAIQSGSLAAGQQLPSTRVLAQDLGVSRGVIVRVYGQLAAEGYLSLRQGAAPSVRATVRLDAEALRPPNARHGTVHDLRPHLPEIATFPRQPWLRAVRESLEQARTADLTYGEASGLWDLRVEVANYLSRARGVLAHPERTLITAGATHALSLVSRMLARRGQNRMAFENPSHPLLRRVALAGGQAVVAAEVDEQGVRPDAIEAADSLFVSPAHQFPTGVVLTPERRTELIAWAQQSDVLILEDDYDAEFRYDGAPVGALQGLAPERVVYIGSTGKTFAPALRLGWAVLPADLADEMAQELFTSMLQVSGFDQLAFRNFLRRGDFDRHLRRMRQVYRTRRDLVVSLLTELLPDHAVRGIAAGLHVVLEMPSHATAEAVRAEARGRGIMIESLAHHAFAGYAGPAGLLLGYGGLPEPTLEEAVRAVAKIIRDVPRQGE
ncbi:MAG TPA: PLP-dependent aminotransferase family protein [Gaiellaceae bacterium]|jgi:GntR family transcriptional regulator/MocR family aminotransferase|nr:PLP-dependent aminotransferase family protein [Gaiellaceae bacterium]